MSIRHKPKQKIDLEQILIDLENPSSENIESLNQRLGKCLDKIEQPLNLSFWESVTYKYWSHVNLIKLADKTYDASSEEFIKRIYAIANEHLRNTPEPTVEERSTEPTKSNSMLSYLQPKYIVGGVVALFVMGVAVKFVKDERV